MKTFNTAGMKKLNKDDQAKCARPGTGATSAARLELCHDTTYLIWQVGHLGLELCHDTTFLIWQVGHLGLELRAILPARDGLILVRAAATYPEEALSDPSPPARSTSDLGEVDF